MSKKFIFSAVALMAFSFAGMANEIEETKVAKRVRSEIIEHIQATLGLYDNYNHYVFDVIYDYDNDVFHINLPVKVWVYFEKVI